MRDLVVAARHAGVNLADFARAEFEMSPNALNPDQKRKLLVLLNATAVANAAKNSGGK
jgi:hypothetical protein